MDIDFGDEIDKAVEDYGDHDGVTRSRVVRWLAQFSESDRDTAAKVLSEIRYHAGSKLRSMARELMRVVYAEFAKVDRRGIYFVPIGAAGSGSQIISRYLRGLNEIPTQQVANLIDLIQMDATTVEVIVFIDDFSGTGGVIREWWERVEPLILPIEARYVSGILVLNYKALESLKEIFEVVLSVDFLDESADVFSQSYTTFTPSEKDTLLRACVATGCSDRFVKGWGDCGLLLAFRHGCPNNSLPILWFDSQNWERFFRRRSA